ncbi:hypothetical protein ACIRG4_34495 [Streptomyces sp. NPDC102395]|uniref:hypothetical protein n=1 Tax=Streptomyces sp. NPDC102395 TaxID=3366168 RepID=UPI0037FF1374
MASAPPDTPDTIEPDGVLAGRHAGEFWAADHDDEEDRQRAVRRRSVLAQITAARRRRRLALPR